jgi:translation initiation factor 6 (eIF-6)
VTGERAEQPTADRGETAIGSSLFAGVVLFVVGGTTTAPALVGLGLLLVALVVGLVVIDDPPA